MLVEKAANLFDDLRRRRVDNTFGEDEVVLMFVHYLYGAISTASPDVKPDVTLGYLAELAEGYLGAIDVMRALHAPPPPEDTPIGRVVRGIEILGRRDGKSILAMLSDTTADSAPEPTKVSSVAVRQTDQSDAKGEFP